MMKQKSKFKLTALIISLGIVMTGALSLGAQPAYAADLKCTILPQSICDLAKDQGTTTKNSAIMELLKLVLRILTAGVGIAAVGALVYAGILYGSAGDNASQTASAKTIITNTVIGIIAYGAMVLFVNFLIPGGVFG